VSVPALERWAMFSYKTGAGAMIKCQKGEVSRERKGGGPNLRGYSLVRRRTNPHLKRMSKN